MPTVNVNNLTMYYEISSDGEPLLIIWGIGGEIPPLLDRLADSAKGNTGSSFSTTGVRAGQTNRICPILSR